MILNFQRRFVPMILDLSKGHTIRGERKDGKRPQPGEMLHLYTGLRQRGAEFILRAPCLRTEDFELFRDPRDEVRTKTGTLIYGPVKVRVAGVLLDASEQDSLAWADGFRYHDSWKAGEPAPSDLTPGCFNLMMQFWSGRPLPFRGWITYWDTSKAKFERKAA